MKIAFVYHSLATFVRHDLDILRQEHQVRAADFRFRPDDAINLAQTVKWSDAVFCWFAARHTLLALLLAAALRKRSFVVTGGYDVASMPEIGYGSLRGGLTRPMAKLIFSMADQLLPFSESARGELIRNGGVAPSKALTINLGVPDSTAAMLVPKERLVLTVGDVVRGNLKRKGLAAFVHAARALPHVPFVMAGRWEDDSIDYLRDVATPNLQFTGFTPEPELHELMERAKVYVQASGHEGFGLALAEAMLHGCIPVVTDRGSLAEVSGGIGLTVPYDDPLALARGIDESLQLGADVARRARQHVLDRFPIERRRDMLLEVVQSRKGGR